MSLILKSYYEEFILIILTFFFGICSIIFINSFSIDNKEKRCVEFYKDNNYITKSCEIFRYKLEAIYE